MESASPKLRFLPSLYLLLATTPVLFLCGLSYRSPVENRIRFGDRVEGILLGTDWVDYSRHADTILFLSYAPGTHSLNVVSVPRDTWIQQEGWKSNRLNEVFAEAYRKSRDSAQASLATAKATVQILEPNPSATPPTHYLQMDYKAFEGFVNLLGGVEVEVEEPMHYDDNSGQLHIHFQPGKKRMNGIEALQYVRYRGASGDSGRMYRQKKFLKSTMQKLIQTPWFLWRLPRMLQILRTHVRTDFSIYDLLVLALEARGLSPDNIRMAQLPGKSKRGKYWEVDREQTRLLLSRIEEKKNLLSSARWTVEVFNASGRSELALKTTRQLRTRGFDVVYYGNYPSLEPKTMVIDRTGQMESAKEIAKGLGFPNPEIFTRLNPDRLVDVTVILGKDCLAPEGED